MASLNTPVNKDTIVSWGAEIYVAKEWGWTLHRVWVFNELSIETGSEAAEFIAHNRKTKLTKNPDLINVNFKWFENTNEIIDVMFGWLQTVTTLTNVLQAGVTQVFDFSTRDYGTTYLIERANANGTAVTINSVTGSVDGALTLTTDYTISVDWFWYTIIEFVSGGNITTLQQSITVDYDVTPKASTIVSYKSCGIPTPFVMIIDRRGKNCTTGLEQSIRMRIANVTADNAFLNFIGDSDEWFASTQVNTQGTILLVEKIGDWTQ